MPQQPEVTGFLEKHIGSIQYVVADPATRKCVIVDPVLDYYEKSAQIATAYADNILGFIAGKGYSLAWIFDTHPHADHFSASSYIKDKTGAPTAIGEKIIGVQTLWQSFYNWPDFPADGSQWDRLFADGETFKIGNIDAKVFDITWPRDLPTERIEGFVHDLYRPFVDMGLVVRSTGKHRRLKMAGLTTISMDWSRRAHCPIRASLLKSAANSISGSAPVCESASLNSWMRSRRRTRSIHASILGKTSCVKTPYRLKTTSRAG